MKVFTVIPARGGSKSIPRKNISLLGGKPLIQYSIEYSLKSKSISNTIVSTDDNEIAEIAKSLGAEVPFLRPKEISGDKTQDFPVFLHALKELEVIYKCEIDFLILLRPTSPLRPNGLIEKALKIMLDNPDCSSVRAVTLTSEHPYRQWKLDGRFIKSIVDQALPFDEPYNIPRQSLPNNFFQTGD